jgi:hypothetical protein
MHHCALQRNVCSCAPSIPPAALYGHITTKGGTCCAIQYTQAAYEGHKEAVCCRQSHCTTENATVVGLQIQQARTWCHASCTTCLQGATALPAAAPGAAAHLTLMNILGDDDLLGARDGGGKVCKQRNRLQLCWQALTYNSTTHPHGDICVLLTVMHKTHHPGHCPGAVACLCSSTPAAQGT